MAITSSYDIVDGNRVDNPTDDTTYVFNPSATLKTFSLAGGTDGDTVAINALSSDFKVKFKKNEMTLIGLKNTPSFGTMVKVQFDTSNGGVDHLAFLDGTVDVQFTPNAPGALKGSWIFGGNSVSKKINLGAEGANYTIDGSKTFADAAYDASGALESQRYVLTTETDDVEVETDNTYDTVRGIIDYQGEDGDDSTYTALDTIIGNGKTQMEIGVVDVNGGYHEADYVRLSGVDKLAVIDAVGSGVLGLDASSYGSDISFISLEGEGGLDMCVCDLDAHGQLNIENANDDSYVCVTGTLDDDLNFEVCITNSQSDTSEVTFGTAGISLVAGECADACLEISHSETASTADAAVGNIALGNIDVAIGADADATISITNCAWVSQAGDATVGNIVVGAIDIDVAQAGDIELNMRNCAIVCVSEGATPSAAADGNATAGNIIIGAMNVAIANSGSFTGYDVINLACVTGEGDATVGNLTIGDMVIAAGDDVCALELTADNCAYAADGNAVAGKLTIGNIDLTAGDDSCFCIEANNEAWAKGEGNDATIGDFALGKMDFEMGNGSSIYVSVSNYGSASCGDLVSGNVTVGDLNLVMGSSSCACFSISSDLDSAHGSVTGGKVTVGNVNVMMGGIDNSFTLWLDNNASACGDTPSVVGDLKIGNIDVYGGADAYVCIDINQYAYEGNAGNVTIGNVDIQIENEGSNSDGSACFFVSASGASVGNVTIGDVSMSGASSASMYNCLYVCASDGNIGNVTVGDISMTVGVSATGYVNYSVCAEDDLGNVTYGDINFDGSAESAYVCGYMWHSADYGSIGEIKTGNITLSAGESASVTLDACWTASDEIGNVSFGDIALSAVGDDGCVCLSIDICNSDDIGNISYGNISLTADGEDACAYAFLSAENDGNHSIGTITAGNIDLSAIGDGACACLSMSFDSSDANGLLTVGNIAINLDIGVTADASVTDDAVACIDIANEAGNLTVGNITLIAAEVTASYDATADVCACVTLEASTTAGVLTVGNITVVGGYQNVGGDADNFAMLSCAGTSWLDLVGDSITVGNIDYSGYEAAATIDVSAWDGAAIIKGAQDDTTITVNDGKNTIYLGDGSDTVNLGANATGPTAAATIDVIYDFTAGDDVLDGDVSGTSFAYNSNASSYDSFITAASNGFLNLDYDVYAARVGGDTYVAFNLDGDTDLDFVVKLVGVTAQINAADVSL